MYRIHKSFTINLRIGKLTDEYLLNESLCPSAAICNLVSNQAVLINVFDPPNCLKTNSDKLHLVLIKYSLDGYFY